MTKLMTFGTIISLIFLVIIFVTQYIKEKKKNKEYKNKEEIIKKVQKEKEQVFEKVNTGNNKSDFDNSINILHEYSSRRK